MATQLTAAAEQLHEISIWIDNHNRRLGKTEGEIAMGRVVKILEEGGEATAKLIALFGQNPRKLQESGAVVELVEELLDVAITALGAADHFLTVKDYSRYFEITNGWGLSAMGRLLRKISSVHDRALVQPSQLPLDAKPWFVEEEIENDSDWATDKGRYAFDGIYDSPNDIVENLAMWRPRASFEQNKAVYRAAFNEQQNR